VPKGIIISPFWRGCINIESYIHHGIVAIGTQGPIKKVLLPNLELHCECNGGIDGGVFSNLKRFSWTSVSFHMHTHVSALHVPGPWRCANNIAALSWVKIDEQRIAIAYSIRGFAEQPVIRAQRTQICHD
jgi:hypothetical protein